MTYISCIEIETETMTTQDLKNNREEILKQMDFVGVHPSMRKEFMKTMVDFAEMGINETEDVCDFVNEIMRMNSNKW
ncbi:MAG TPA: hypothetical protein VFM82_05790, partial [Flavobacteriaceae bacterium]|nr:hypothetical protein [Flavobacteriaceae bacterium]